MTDSNGGFSAVDNISVTGATSIGKTADFGLEFPSLNLSGVLFDCQRFLVTAFGRVA